MATVVGLVQRKLGKHSVCFLGCKVTEMVVAACQEWVAEGPGCLPCPEGWHTARVKCSSSSTRLQRCLGSSACRRWPMQAQWSGLEWYESSENPVAREQKAPQLRQELVLHALAAPHHDGC